MPGNLVPARISSECGLLVVEEINNLKISIMKKITDNAAYVRHIKRLINAAQKAGIKTSISVSVVQSIIYLN
jgi:hypothetical protein